MPLIERLNRIEQRIGADRPGRSPWFWLIPPISAIITFALCLGMSLMGQLDVWVSITLSAIMAAFIGLSAVVNLTSGVPDGRQAEVVPWNGNDRSRLREGIGPRR